LIRRSDLVQLAVDRAGLPGARRTAFAADAADAGSQSPPESRLRVRLLLAGLPRPVTQFPIQVRGGGVFHPDLAWPEYKVAVEYDGAWHATFDQTSRDHRRRNRLLNEGWIVIHVTGDRMRDDFDGVLAEIRVALRSRGWRR
jgi:very-short-patch-repair endonuclease